MRGQLAGAVTRVALPLNSNRSVADYCIPGGGGDIPKEYKEVLERKVNCCLPTMLPNGYKNTIYDFLMLVILSGNKFLPSL